LPVLPAPFCWLAAIGLQVSWTIEVGFVLGVKPRPKPDFGLFLEIKMLYELKRFDEKAKLWIKVGKSTNLFYATKRAVAENLRLSEYEIGKIVMNGYEPPEIQAREDRSVRQLRKDSSWDSSQIWA
jgi:hypothetical protein